MLARTLRRSGFGFLLGIAVGNLIAICFGWPDAVVTEKLLALSGSLCVAVLWQTLLSGVIGAAAFAGVGLYERDDWSLFRVAVAHYLIIEAAYLPIAFALGWIETAAGALSWLLFSAVAYLLIFLILCAFYRAQVRELNKLNELRKRRGTKTQIGGAI